MAKFEITGLNQLYAKLGRIADYATDMPTHKRILLAQAQSIANAAKSYAPVDTGHLRDHIGVQEIDRGYQVISSATYSSFQEFGTKRNAAHPFMRPAFYQHSAQIMKNIADEEEKALKDAIGS